MDLVLRSGRCDEGGNVRRLQGWKEVHGDPNWSLESGSLGTLEHLFGEHPAPFGLELEDVEGEV